MLLRDIVNISNNLKRSSNYKGKIGKITKLLHNLALIRDSLFLSSLSGLWKKDGEWQVQAHGQTPVPRGVLGPQGFHHPSRCNTHLRFAARRHAPWRSGRQRHRRAWPYHDCYSATRKDFNFPSLVFWFQDGITFIQILIPFIYCRVILLHCRSTVLLVL